MSHSLHPYIIKLINANSRVLDCGCGDGTLLKELHHRKHVTGYGIDIDSSNIISCINRGLSVYHGDILEGLSELPDQRFDHVILSLTLQQIQHPIPMIHELCRVGKDVIVTFPNFAHWKCRLSLLRGVIPKTKSLPYYWYDTPNIRVISVKSFKAVCKQESIDISQTLSFYKGSHINASSLTNLLADHVLFKIKKQS